MKKHILFITKDVDFSLRLKSYLLSKYILLEVLSEIQESTRENIKNGKYSLVFLDIDTRKPDAVEFLRVTKENLSTPIVIFSTVNDFFDKLFLLESGADDILLKSIDFRELFARIKIIARRLDCSSRSTKIDSLSYNKIQLSPSKRLVHNNGNPIDLTGTEFEILHLLMANAGAVVSKLKIGKELFNRTVSSCDRSIDMHICNIRKKLSSRKKDTQTKIKTISGFGYIFIT